MTKKEHLSVETLALRRIAGIIECVHNRCISTEHHDRDPRHEITKDEFNEIRALAMGTKVIVLHDE